MTGRAINDTQSIWESRIPIIRFIINQSTKLIIMERLNYTDLLDLYKGWTLSWTVYLSGDVKKKWYETEHNTVAW